jgi:hypothetical protein
VIAQRLAVRCIVWLGHLLTACINDNRGQNDQWESNRKKVNACSENENAESKIALECPRSASSGRQCEEQRNNDNDREK